MKKLTIKDYLKNNKWMYIALTTFLVGFLGYIIKDTINYGFDDQKSVWLLFAIMSAIYGLIFTIDFLRQRKQN